MTYRLVLFLVLVVGIESILGVAQGLQPAELLGVDADPKYASDTGFCPLVSDFAPKGGLRARQEWHCVNEGWYICARTLFPLSALSLP